jgi:formate dehydrogenase
MHRNPKPGHDGDHITFCRICEAACGIVATVEGGRITSIAPDRDNPLSQGHVCVKGIALGDLAYDPDRVTRPLKRVGGPGEFKPITWDEALDGIAKQLLQIRNTHGTEAIASYLGNPAPQKAGFNEFLTAIGSFKRYGAASQDTSATMLASSLAGIGVYPTAGIPDLANLEFFLILGSNLLVSNGWLFWGPRLRQELDAIAKRGRVVVVDPRRTETARQYEHVPIQPNTDVWLLAGMMRVLLDEGRLNEAWLTEVSEGWVDLRAAIRSVEIDEAARRTGIPTTTITELAQSFVATNRSALSAVSVSGADRSGCWARSWGSRSTSSPIASAPVAVCASASRLSGAWASRCRCHTAGSGRALGAYLLWVWTSQRPCCPRISLKKAPARSARSWYPPATRY